MVAFSEERVTAGVVDGLLEAVTEVEALDSASVVSFVGCAKVGMLQSSRKGLHLRNSAPIVGIAWVHSLSKPRALRMGLSSVV